MAGPRLKALRKQFDEIRTSIDTINRAAADQGRDLTDDESADLDKLFDRAEQLKPEIETEVRREESIASVAEVIGRVGGSADVTDRSVRRDDAPELDAASYFAEFFQAASAGDMGRFLDRAARYIDRTQAGMTTADTAGILPEPIVGNVIKFADSMRPVFASLTTRPMPNSGKKFTRPRVTQRTQVGEQNTELTQVASRKMTLTADEVTKRTFAGSLDISQQDLDWTDPAVLAIVISDFAEYYAEVTEGAACTFLEGIPDSYSPWAVTDTNAVLESFADGAVEVYGQCKRMPDTLWISLDEWATMAALVDGQDRPLFPQIGSGMINVSTNQLGGTPLGLRVVTGPQFTAGTRILGVSGLAESYEQNKGLLRATLPNVLGASIAYFGYVAFHGREEGFVILGTDPAA